MVRVQSASGAAAEGTLCLASIRRGGETPHHSARVPEYRAGVVFFPAHAQRLDVFSTTDAWSLALDGGVFVVE